VKSVTWLAPVFTIVSILAAVAADVLIFLWLYLVLSPTHLKPARKPLLRGAVLASVAFEALKFGLTFLLPLLLTSVTAKLFGQVIGLLFFFNLVATAVLFIAAWIATDAGQPCAAEPHAAHPRRQ
jgi:membrane protein